MTRISLTRSSKIAERSGPPPEPKKELCRLAGINEEIRVTTYRGNVRTDKNQPKWKTVPFSGTVSFQFWISVSFISSTDAKGLLQNLIIAS